MHRRLEPLERLLSCHRQAFAHELPNHLAAIQGLLRVLDLEEGERLSPEGRDYLRRLHVAAHRTHALIRALAQLNDVTGSDEPAELSSIPDAAREAVAAVKLLSPGCQFEYDFPEAVPVFRVPQRSLHLVLVHLLRYAVSGIIEADPITVQIGARNLEHGGAEFWVRDHGVEMSPEQQARCFEPFASIPHHESGHELELFLVREVVERWGGTIRVHSEPGQGNTFIIQAGGS